MSEEREETDTVIPAGGRKEAVGGEGEKNHIYLSCQITADGEI